MPTLFSELDSSDRALVAESLQGFVPPEVYDIHAHVFHPAHFASGTVKFIEGKGVLGCEDHRHSLRQYMPFVTCHGLYFGFPEKKADRAAMNPWVAAEVAAHGSSLSRTLMVVSPSDDRRKTAAALRQGNCCGFKVYACFADRADAFNAVVEEYAPEWMWELLDDRRGVLLVHLFRANAMADPQNQASIRRLCRAYPRVQLVLAHVARSFNYRHARAGLHAIADLENVVVDTSAVTESEAFRAALKTLGPRRILWGSDYAVSELRGRCVTTGSRFFWLHPEVVRENPVAPTPLGLTLVGIESLLCLREACEDFGLTAGDLGDIFLNNARRVLRAHLPDPPALVA